MLQQLLTKFFANIFYRTTSDDWYLSKGYYGPNIEEQFNSFIASQREEGAVFYDEFQYVHLKRQVINSCGYELDSVLIKYNEFDKIPNAQGIYFILSQGRGEYYESRFRDMAIQARETKSSVLGYNPKGFKSSTGKTQTIFDLVEDAKSVIRYLLDEEHALPANIILQGNSLGAAVLEMASEYYRKHYNLRFRQINSNSFRSLAAVLAYHYKLPFLEKFIRQLLLHAKWEVIPGADFYQTSPYRCILRRLNDRTILLGAEFFAAIDIVNDNASCATLYRETNLWLYNHCQLVYKGNSETDPHFLSLHHFHLPGIEGNSQHSVYKYINLFVSESQKLLQD